MKYRSHYEFILREKCQSSPEEAVLSAAWHYYCKSQKEEDGFCFLNSSCSGACREKEAKCHSSDNAILKVYLERPLTDFPEPQEVSDILAVNGVFHDDF
jgi:hypothetical protein